MKPFAFVFPGQGSQSVGMLDAWGDHPAVRNTLLEASAALGEDIARLIHEGPKEALELTTNTQPVMLTAAIACYRAWRHEGGDEPAAVAGHSLGEYSALVAAGALSLDQALPLVRFRAQAMQEAVPVGVGAMAAVMVAVVARRPAGVVAPARGFRRSAGAATAAACAWRRGQRNAAGAWTPARGTEPIARICAKAIAPIAPTCARAIAAIG